MKLGNLNRLFEQGMQITDYNSNLFSNAGKTLFKILHSSKIERVKELLVLIEVNKFIAAQL
jgi:D-lyxose ketol-isomerase